MGIVRYGATGTEIQLADRTMAHLQAVVATKLRRGEGFFINWRVDGSADARHSAAWVGPNTQIVFEYAADEHVDLRRDWLEIMTMGANSNGGLYLSDEPPATDEGAEES